LQRTKTERAREGDQCATPVSHYCIERVSVQHINRPNAVK